MIVQKSILVEAYEYLKKNKEEGYFVRVDNSLGTVSSVPRINFLMLRHSSIFGDYACFMNGEYVASYDGTYLEQLLGATK